MPFETVEASLNETDLTALLGSRLCHDLISPIGAIANGLELLTMSCATQGPEIELIEQSVAAANARVKFFRVAFGQSSEQQQLGQPEIASLLAGISAQGRLRLHWEISGDHARGLVKLAFLSILCLETVLPYGGTITVRDCGGRWEIGAQSEKARGDARLFSTLDGAHIDVTPAQVQFALLPRLAARLGLGLDWALTETGGVIRF
ncbi:histidine phosphotransferase [Thioclava sp. L04-15]|uniref:histidine phosphotransferase family protein n=1 Tax=Thioclava sp. L04-15 TaxID=1915318 RepID=UPI000998075D|nr:histidine phosphotransferase family protein [Thioclava sp. L04-15]OOY28268.1 histidine phosphotransferase [Thioclava sp. L04-15]TNE88835.1 MAG: histidine phosphotransferase [Paracoccaceae bacterium]